MVTPRIRNLVASSIPGLDADLVFPSPQPGKDGKARPMSDMTNLVVGLDDVFGAAGVRHYIAFGGGDPLDVVLRALARDPSRAGVFKEKLGAAPYDHVVVDCGPLGPDLLVDRGGERCDLAIEFAAS